MECGEKLRDDQQFCPNCGTKVIRQEEETKEQGYTGQTFTENDFQPVNDQPAPAPKKNMKKILIAICAVAVVAALVAVVLLLTLPRCSKNKDAEEKILEPSKEKIVSLEGSCLDQVWNTAKEGVSSFKDSKFDADVTVDLKVDSYYAGSSASTIANYLPYVTLNLAKDQMNVAAKLTVWATRILICACLISIRITCICIACRDPISFI